MCVWCSVMEGCDKASRELLITMSIISLVKYGLLSMDIKSLVNFPNLSFLSD